MASVVVMEALVTSSSSDLRSSKGGGLTNFNRLPPYNNLAEGDFVDALIYFIVVLSSQVVRIKSYRLYIVHRFYSQRITSYND